MPKECAHWIIARRAAASCAGPRVKALLHRWEPLYLLGSVLPDTAFYAFAGRHRARLLEVAQTLHGSRGGDPLFFLERAAGDREPSEPRMALALGAVCHIMTDSQFHPIVYHFCGLEEEHEGALRRHFLFEGWLDVHYRSLESPPGHGKLVSILRSAPQPFREVAAAARALFFDGPASQRSVAAALRRHARIQRLFYNRMAAAAAAAVRRFAPAAGGTFEALVYPRAEGPVPFFSRPFSYRHPLTGEERTETLADVEGRVAALMREAFGVFEAEAPRRAAVARVPRLSAETGGAPSARPRAEALRWFDVADVEALLGVRARGAAR